MSRNLYTRSVVELALQRAGALDVARIIRDVFIQMQRRHLDAISAQDLSPLERKSIEFALSSARDPIEE